MTLIVAYWFKQSKWTYIQVPEPNIRLHPAQYGNPVYCHTVKLFI